MRKKAWTFGILTGLLLSVLCPFTVQAQIASPQAFQNLSWKMVKEESIETEHGVVQSICATDDYIVCLENVLDGSGQPDIVKAYYRNDKDKNGNRSSSIPLQCRYRRQIMNMPMEWHIIRIPMRSRSVFIPVIRRKTEDVFLSWMQIH